MAREVAAEPKAGLVELSATVLGGQTGAQVWWVWQRVV